MRKNSCMRVILFFVLLAGALTAQTSPAPQPTKDPLGRDTPQDAVFQFLEACHARNYAKAKRYLDLRSMSLAERAKSGPDLARQLEDVLDDTQFDITMLSRDPEGDVSDNLAANLEDLYTFRVGTRSMELQLERVQLRPGLRVWLVSAASIPLIPKAHQLIQETPFESKLPQPLVTFEVFDTPVWRWIVLVLAGAALWAAASILSSAVVAVVRRVKEVGAFRGPLRAVLVVAGFRAVMAFVPPAAIPHLVLERALGLFLALAGAWAAAILIDLLTNRWHSRLDPRAQAIGYSVLPLGKQIMKMLLFLIAILSVLGAWGYNTSAILAGLGVGGLAFALAAQKTIENLFGGISVIGDRPVLVGDFCRFGDRSGTVTHIGLRSTRIRTPDRTLISVPNGQFSTMELENFSVRDKIWFHPTLNLRRDTTAEQLRGVLSSVEEILKHHPKVEAGDLPVRFIGMGTYSLNVEVSVYVSTPDYDEFLRLQQELLFKILQAVQTAGAALAVPVQETVELARAGRA